MEPTIAIIGAGPAGMATALQLKRSGLEPLLLERGRPGGLLLNAHLVENYMGFPQGITGEELVALFKAQLDRLAVAICPEEVIRLDHDGQSYTLETPQRTISPEVVVLASGTRARGASNPQTGEQPWLHSMPQEAGERVFVEAYPLKGLEGKRIAVVGAGDGAFDQALLLAQRNTVFILCRGEGPCCLPLLSERARREPQIDIWERTVISSLAWQQGALLHLVTRGQAWEMRIDYLLLAIGREPELAFLTPSLRQRMDSLRDGGLLHLVGDVHRGIYRQTAMAVGDGIEAAMRIVGRQQH